ncbi:MAG: SPOR domain-containing protein [Deltaproteobacteria bacterium]|nr:SPOR domain-containing protein [Deltaproteobacteria bacterium]
MAAKNRRMFELRLGKVGLILFIGGMSLLLFSMFSLGIYVGKDMEAYPERFSSGMAGVVRERLFLSAPQTEKAEPPTETAKRDEPAGGEETAGLTPYDAPGGKKAGEAAGTVKDPSPERSVAPPVPAAGTAASVPPASVAAAGSAAPAAVGGDGKKPSPPAERKPAANSGPGSPAAVPAGKATASGEVTEEGRFEVQVAAYQDRQKAVQTTEKLRPHGFTSRVVMKEIPGKGKWFRVIVGGFENREKAKAAADQIAGKIRGAQCVIRPAGS